MVRATFVMEQHLGHLTYYRNLRSFVETSEQLAARWVPVTYEQQSRLWERIRGLPPSVRGALRGREQVRSALHDATGDVLFFNTQAPAVLGGALARQKPYVISTDITPIQYDGMAEQYGHTADQPGLLKAFKHHANVRVLRGAVRLLPWSTWACDSLVADYGVDPARVEVLPPGVDTSIWRPGAPHAGPPRILFVGGDLGRKGGDMLLEVFRALPAGSAELHLVTRSDAPQQEGVRVYRNLEPNSPELIALFASADIFVLPSHAEAFGIVGAEAAASGLPSVVTAVGGLTDIVADGENGFLIAPGDGGALAERLRQLVNHAALREQMGRAARERAETFFDARRNAQRLIDCLRAAAEVAR